MNGRFTTRAAALLSLAVLAGPLLAAPPATEDWKPIENGVLKIDDRPVKTWEIYLTGNDKHLVLLQLGARFLLLNTEAQEVTELAPEILERRGQVLRWTPGKDPQKQTVLPSEEWSQKHAGRARIIRLRLTKEGRRIEVQLPVTPDLRKFY